MTYVSAAACCSDEVLYNVLPPLPKLRGRRRHDMPTPTCRTMLHQVYKRLGHV